MPRVYAPDEELTFRFTASEINSVIAAIETTLGLPLRITAPLREKILMQLNAEPGDAAGAGDGLEKPLGLEPLPVNRASSRSRN